MILASAAAAGGAAAAALNAARHNNVNVNNNIHDFPYFIFPLLVCLFGIMLVYILVAVCIKKLS